jgi:hypothetical protein
MNSDATKQSPWKGRRQALAALLLSCALWLPAVHWLFVRTEKSFTPHAAGLAPKAQALAARHLQLWTNAPLRSAEIWQRLSRPDNRCPPGDPHA